MKKEMSVVLSLLVLGGWLGATVWFHWSGDNRVVSYETLAPDMDSEKLLYDDAFMDEAIRRYTLRSLTASLSRLGYARGIDCHDRAHEMGRRAYEVVGSEAFKSCGIECHSGCRHGATEAFFADKGTSDLISGMGVLCGDEMGNKFHMHQCIHGIGHGLMAWYDYDLHKALQACDLIEHPFHQSSCYSGVFMENIVGSIVRDESTPDGKVSHHTDFLNDDPHYPCNILADRYKWQCYWVRQIVSFSFPVVLIHWGIFVLRHQSLFMIPVFTVWGEPPLPFFLVMRGKVLNCVMRYLLFRTKMPVWGVCCLIFFGIKHRLIGR